MSVTGIAEIQVDRDLLEMSIRIESHSANLDSARTEHNRRARSIIQTLESVGFDEDQYSTDGMAVGPNMRYRYSDTEIPAGQRFYAEQTIELSTRSLASADTLVALLLDRGATSVREFRYTYSRMDSLKHELRKLAVRDARLKAEELAAALGLQVVGLVSISDENDPWNRRVVVTAEREDIRQSMLVSSAPATAPGKQTVRVEVRGHFSMGPPQL